MIEHALHYARQEWSVFPVHGYIDGSCTCGDPECPRPGKHPRTPNGFLGASTDPDQINDWWTKYPSANIGIATGKMSSGLFVIDIDRKPEAGILGEDSWDDACGEDAYPATLEVTSGSGGRHIYFRYTGDTRIVSGQNRLGPGVDIRADNGYIIAPPSTHLSGNNYTWYDSDPEEGDTVAVAPDWLIKALNKPPTLQVINDTAIALSPEKTQEIRSALGFIDPELRENWLNIGMALHSTCANDQAYGLWNEWAMRSPKFDPKDQGYTWSHMHIDGGITLATLFGMARANGWIEPENFSEGDVVEVASEAVIKTSAEGLYHPPGILEDIVQFMLDTAPFPRRPLAVGAALTLMGTALGRKVMGSTKLRTNLYIVGVANAGAGKDHARQVIKQLLHESDLDELIGGETIASGGGLIARIRRTPSVLFQIDEFGDLMRALTGSRAGRWDQEIITNLMKLYTSSGSIFYGTEYADQEKSEKLKVEYPCASLHATTTPRALYEGFASNAVVSGFLPRMLIIDVSNDPKPQRQVLNEDIDTPIQIIDWLKNTKRIAGEGDMMGISPACPLKVTETGEAAQLFALYQKETDYTSEINKGNGVDALWGRAWEQANKIATICACGVTLEKPEVTKSIALWAIRFVSYHLEKEAIEVRLRLAHTAYERQVKDIYRAIYLTGSRGITLYEMGRQTPFTRMKDKERDVILASLITNRRIALVNTKRRSAYVAIK